ncbi:MAG: GDSL-type esterase/lipase family protein [Ruminococcus sp.]|nr:GDSL-type esterase/lipase family protein [Ruminococcus sp.]
MNKYKQCMYTVILILTCLVASPFIYKQIWNSSSLKQAKAEKKTPALSTTVSSTAPVVTTVSDGTTSASKETSAETTVTTAQPETVFGTSDPSYFDDVLFIGDSRTVGIKEYGTLKNADYFCSVGLASYKINNEYIDGCTLKDKLSSNQYGKIYIMLGINEVANDTEYTIAAFRTLVETIREYQPYATIMLQANLHVSSAAQTDSITNAGIDELNYKIYLLAEETDNTYFININDVFDDENGALTADFTSDGIHVLGKYYQDWCTFLCNNTIIVKVHSTETTETVAEEETEPEAEGGDDYDIVYDSEEPVNDGGDVPEDNGSSDGNDDIVYYDDNSSDNNNGNERHDATV